MGTKPNTLLSLLIIARIKTILFCYIGFCFSRAIKALSKIMMMGLTIATIIPPTLFRFYTFLKKKKICILIIKVRA